MTASERTEPTASQRRPLLAPLLASLLVIGLLFGVDFSLAKMERAELTSEAQDHYQQGIALLKQGRAAQAAEQLRRATSLARDNREYRLELAAALLATRRFDDAGKQLDDLLQADPNDGRANLLTARLRVQQGQFEDAQAYYHRSIYGSWKDNPAAHRLEVRLELADFLASRGDRRDLLAELLPLEREAPPEPAMRERIGRLFLEAGSPARAADMFRELIRAGVTDPTEYLGLGEAELNLGNYRDAFAAFLSLTRQDPNASGAREKMVLANTMTALDPTPRWLSSDEKYARSSRILEMTRDSLRQCVNGGMVTEPSKLQPLLDDASAMLAAKSQPRVTNELAEERLTMAEQLWQARTKVCPPGGSPQEEPLRLIMEKLTRTPGH